MKYYKKLHDGIDGIMHHTPEEITYKEALGLLQGVYKNNDMTRDMLEINNTIWTPYSMIIVGVGAKDGWQNLIPDDVEYDEDGNHR